MLVFKFQFTWQKSYFLQCFLMAHCHSGKDTFSFSPLRLGGQQIQQLGERMDLRHSLRMRIRIKRVDIHRLHPSGGGALNIVDRMIPHIYAAGTGNAQPGGGTAKKFPDRACTCSSPDTTAIFNSVRTPATSSLRFCCIEGPLVITPPAGTPGGAAPPAQAPSPGTESRIRGTGTELPIDLPLPPGRRAIPRTQKKESKKYSR